MGIKGINSILKKECNDIFVQKSLLDYAGKIVAIDISIFLYKYVKSVGENRWFHQIIMLLCNLKKNRIKSVCIFDGPNPPIEKKDEQKKRQDEFKKNESKLDYISKLKDLVDVQYYFNNESIPTDLQNELKEIFKRCKIVKQDGNKVDFSDSTDMLFMLKKRENTIKNQIEPVKPIYKHMLIKFLDIMGMSYMTADGEAETLCAWLAKCGKVDAVLSEDTDVMVYGTPFFLSKIQLDTGKIIEVCYKNMLSRIGMDSNMFIDFCIFSRCDYNKHCEPVTVQAKKKGGKPVPIGPRRAFNLIKEYKCFENIENNTDIDLSPLNWKRCREIFKTPPKDVERLVVPYCKEPKYDELIDFLKEYNLAISPESIRSWWKPVGMIFED